MGFKGRDFLKITDFSRKEIVKIFRVAEGFEEIYRSRSQLEIGKGKILANLFFQPSTRTRFSFQTAMLRLGGEVIGFERAATTAMAKGEKLRDTIRMINKYSNIIVQRHPEPGSADLAAEVAEIPIINAGDGANRHPTQALLDMYSIRKFKGKIKDIKVAIWGDLKNSRCNHSLSLGLAMFGADIVYSSPKGLETPEDIRKELKERFGVEPQRLNPDEALKSADVLYHVGPLQDVMIGGRSQASEEEREKIKEEFRKHFRINLSRLKRLGVKDDLIIMHPLPRQLENLSPDIDSTKYCGYFVQAGYGVPVRMALLSLLLGLVS